MAKKKEINIISLTKEQLEIIYDEAMGYFNDVEDGEVTIEHEWIVITDTNGKIEYDANYTYVHSDTNSHPWRIKMKKKVYCEDCKYQNYHKSIGLEPCEKHPFTRKNRDHKCPSYKRKWWKIWALKK